MMRRLSAIRGSWQTVVIAVLVGAGLVWTWPRAGRTPEERAAIAAGRTVVTYWDRHSEHEFDSRVALIEEFNRSQDEIYVRAVPIGYNASMEKMLTAIAGGAPPDICALDTPIMQQLAPEGCFLPLDDLVASTPAMQPDRYFPYCWETVAFEGHVWGIPTTTDVYCLVWNKAAFREAGLDPERPPRTIAELEDFAAKLTKRAPDGTIEQMGFLPWLPWDMSHMWGSMFGGDWYDEAAGRISIADDPGIIGAFAWQQSFTLDPDRAEQLPYAMDPERVAAFTKGIGEYFSANNPFYSGKVAMIAEGEWQVTFIPKYAPGLEWGVAPLPQPEGVRPLGYSPACIADVVPSTARNPEAAKSYLRWFYSPRPDTGVSPASDFAHAIHNIPPRKEEAMQERFMGHPKFRVYVEQLLDQEVVSYPNMPVAQFYNDQWERQRERVVFRRVSPEEAVREIEEAVNRELDRVRDLQQRREEGGVS